MHQSFSDPHKIDKMVRTITVFIEQETLELDTKSWKDNELAKIGRSYGLWVKYVSTKSHHPREVFIYWDTDYEDTFSQKLSDKLATDTNYFDKLESGLLTFYQNFKKLTDSYYKKGAKFYNQQSNKQLINLFQHFNQINHHALAAYYIVYYMVDSLLLLVKEDIKKALPILKIKELDQIFEVLSTVGIKTTRQIEMLAFLNSLKKIQALYHQTKKLTDPRIARIIFKHWYNFGSCRYIHETNQTYTLADYKSKFADLIHLDAAAELKKIEDNYSRDQKQINQLLSKFKNFPNIVRHILWLRKMMDHRNQEIEFYNGCFDHTLDFFSEIANRLNISLEDLWILSKQEIINGLARPIDVKAIARERQEKGFIIKQIKDKIKVLTGVPSEDWHEKETQTKTQQLTGKTACQGQATGIVRIIFNPISEGKNFKEGEILVTSMTTPDYVPLMKRAKAIITDEGGLLCHAAIVSRELNKPCVIGTKIATQILKNGDLVRVNAYKGIINFS